MSVKIISMFTVVFLCNLYNLLLGFNPCWKSCSVCFLMYYSTVATVIDIYSQY